MPFINREEKGRPVKIKDEGVTLVNNVASIDMAGSGVTGSNVGDEVTETIPGGVTDHGALTGLSDDDHTQYALLAGRSGGQVLIGGTASGNNLTLQSTSHSTKGKLLFGTSAYDEVNNRQGIGTDSPATKLHLYESANADVSLRIEATGAGATPDLTLKSLSPRDGDIFWNDGSNAGRINYNHATNAMTFFTNGSLATPKMTIADSGAISMFSTLVTGGDITINNASANASLKFQKAGVEQSRWDNDLFGTDGASMSIYTKEDGGSTTRKMIIEGGGKVGVGIFSSLGGRLHVKTGSASEVGIISQGTTLQSGDYFQAKNVSGTALAKIDSFGDFIASGRNNGEGFYLINGSEVTVPAMVYVAASGGLGIGNTSNYTGIYIGSQSLLWVSGTGNTTVGGGGYNTTSDKFSVFSALAAQIAVRIGGTTSQTGHLTQWENVSGNSLAYVNANGGAVFNEQGLDTDFRVETDNDVNSLFIQGSTDRVGIGTSSPTAKLDINSDILRLRTAKTPASSGASGNQGDICWDSDYIYLATATNTWKRAAVATW